MPLHCKGKCIKYIAKKDGHKKRYENGQSRCQKCVIYIKWDGVYCPCCGGRLRKSARVSKTKIKKYVDDKVLYYTDF